MSIKYNNITNSLAKYFIEDNKNIYKEHLNYFSPDSTHFETPATFNLISFQNHINPDFYISYIQNSLNVLFLIKTIPQSHYHAGGQPSHLQFSLMKDDSIVMQFFFFFLLYLFNKAREHNIKYEKLIIAFLKATEKDPSFQGVFLRELLIRLSYLFLDLDFDAVRNAEENKYKRCVIEDFFNCFFQLNPMTLEEKQNDSSFYYNITKHKKLRLFIEEETDTWISLNYDRIAKTDFFITLNEEKPFLEGKKLVPEYFNGTNAKRLALSEYQEKLQRKIYIGTEKALDPHLIPIFLFCFDRAIEHIQYEYFPPDETRIEYSFFLEIAMGSFNSTSLASAFLKMFQDRITNFPYIYPQLALLKKRSEIESFVNTLVKEQGQFKAASTIALHYEACRFFREFFPLAYYLKTYKNERTENEKEFLDDEYKRVSTNVEAFEEYFSIDTNGKHMDITPEEEREKITRAVGIII